MSERSQLLNKFIAWLDTNSIAIMTGIATLLATLAIVYGVYMVIQLFCNDCWPVAPIGRDISHD